LLSYCMFLLSAVRNERTVFSVQLSKFQSPRSIQRASLIN
jgi:hypothetical protein